MGDNSHNSQYTLDEAISSLGIGRFQWLALAYAGFGWMSDSMELMLLSFIGPAVQSQWKLSPSKESLLSTMVFVGTLIGSYFWGFISDSYGRRKGIVGSVMVIVAAGIFGAFSPNYTLLIILGCFLGFGVGGGQVFSLWYLEFVPTQNRGKWMILYSSFWTFGSVIEAALGWIIMPRLSWRWLIAFTTLPSLFVLLFSSFPPESPRFLCVKGRINEAQSVLKKVEKWNRAKLPPGVLIHDQRTLELESEEAPLLSSSSSSTSDAERSNTISKNLSSVLTLFSSKLIRITIPLWFFFFGIVFLYYGIILMTSEFNINRSCNSSTMELLQQQQKKNMYLNVFITSLAETPGLIFSAIIVDKIGRKITMALSCFLSFIVLMPLIVHQNEAVTTSLLFGARMFIIATTTVLVTYAREVYPTSVRSVGVGIATAMGKIGAIVCPFVAVGLVRGCHQAAAVVLFEVITVVLGLCVLLLPFDTMGRKLTDTVQDHH